MLNSVERAPRGKRLPEKQCHKAVLLKPAGPDREPEPSHFSR